MDPGTGKLQWVDSDVTARKLGLVPVKRDLTEREKMEMQIRLYSPCVCCSGKKFKFCCKK